MNCQKDIKGFTLLELLLVIAILVLLYPATVGTVNFSELSSDDAGTRRLVEHIVSSAYLTGLIGNEEKALIKFSKNTGKIIFGNNELVLPNDYKVISVKLDDIEIADNALIEFKTSGGCYISNNMYKKLQLELKKDGCNSFSFALNFPVIRQDSKQQIKVNKGLLSVTESSFKPYGVWTL